MTTTFTDLRQYIGRSGAVHFNGAWFAVTVLDARNRGWGQIDVLVTPVTGSGSFWTLVEKVDWAI